MRQLVQHYTTASQSQRRDIVFHVLSLNGFYHYLFLLIEMRNSKHHSYLLQHVKGVIIDSAPARITFEILTRGFVGAVMGVFKHKVSRYRLLRHVRNFDWISCWIDFFLNTRTILKIKFNYSQYHKLVGYVGINMQGK